MHPLMESLWECFDCDNIPDDPHLTQVRENLYAQLSAAVSEEFMEKVRGIHYEIEEAYAREAFRQGFCLGGQLVLAMLSENFTPA